MRYLNSVLALCLTTAAYPDTLTLRSGKTVEGTYLGGTARDIRMEVGNRIETFGVDQVSGVQFGGTAPQAATRSSNFDGPRDAAAPPVQNSRAYQPDLNANSYNGIEIPAGTPITVRMIDSVDSDTARLGESFRASVDEPVVVNGNTLIPRGADVVAKIVDDRRSGKIQGRTSLSLALVSVRAGDRMVDVSTGDVTQASGSRGARSAKVVGGTAALGAIIGGIAGGGRGAAIGAGSGAAVGTGAEMTMKGQRVKIPSETRLTFTLTNPVRI
ncbi:MAG: TrbI/VirB10 family protein [Acidobacteriota bacterium]|nr:TrbI/VirB10 family protein [Acidobacteriota bacterium]